MPYDDDFEDEEAYHIDDDDGGTDSDADPCAKCDCLRESHEGGTGRCTRCGRCLKFEEM